MSLARSFCAVFSLPGSVLVVGGWDFRGDAVDTTKALSIQTMTFAAGPTMLAARHGLAACVLPHDLSPRRALVVGGSPRSALVVGGYDGFSHLATTEVLTAAD